MKILVCTNAYPPRFVGGAELVAHALAKQWRNAGHELAVFAGGAVSDPTTCTVQAEYVDGIPVRRVASNHEGILSSTAQTQSTEAEFRRCVEQFRPDITHFHNIAGLSYRLPEIATVLGSKSFLTLHDFWGACPKNTLLMRDGSRCTGIVDTRTCALCLSGEVSAEIVTHLENRRHLIEDLQRNVAAFISPSNYLKQRYIESGMCSGSITVIQNGAEEVCRPDRRSLAKEGQTRLLFVGFLGEHKGVHHAIRALSITLPEVTLDVVGEGPEAERLFRLAAVLGVKGRVHFRGKFLPSEMRSVYQQTDGLVLPSIWDENQPVCIMEAMSSGLPVIASRVGGIPEIVADGKTGILVPPGDVVALAGAMNRLVDPDLRGRLGHNGLERVVARTYRNQAEAMLDLFARTPPF